MRSLAAVSSLLFLTGLITLNAPSASAVERTVSKANIVAGDGSENYGVFTAGSAGATLRLVNRAELRLEPGTAVRVFPTPQKLQLSGNAKVSTWSVAVVKGRVDASLPSRTQTALLVSVGDLSVITTGGQFALLARDRDTIVASREGEVRMLVNKRWQDMQPGQQIMLTPSHPAGTAVQAANAPELISGQRVWFGTDSTPISGFSWKPIANAIAYDVRLKGLNKGEVLGLQRTKSTQLNQALASVPPGNYSIALRSIDARGMEGGWSPETTLRVVGLKLPPGGYVADGKVFIGQSQRLEFLGAEGIEVSHITSGGYVPASQGLVLERDKTTIVSVRIPGTNDISVLRLEPRGVYADVRVGPKLAVWPNDSISINVELKNRQQQPVPSWIQPVAKVRLGTELIHVDLQRSGNTLRGVVPPAAGRGPWILRVEIEDQYGVPLGRDFVEIASAPRRTAKRPPSDPARSARR